MGIYQFNIRDRHGVVVDEDGVELPNILSVVQEAVRSAREFAAEAQVADDMAFEITDATGRLVLSLPIGTHAGLADEQGLTLAF